MWKSSPGTCISSNLQCLSGHKAPKKLIQLSARDQSKSNPMENIQITYRCMSLSTKYIALIICSSWVQLLAYADIAYTSWYFAANLHVTDFQHEIQTCSCISSPLGTKHCRCHHYIAIGHECFRQFLMYCFDFLLLGRSVLVLSSHSSTFMTFVDATEKSSAALPALRELCMLLNFI